MLKKVYRFARKDLVVLCSGRNPPFQILNLARFYLGPKVLGESTTALSYRGGIFLGHPEPVVSGMTIFLDVMTVLDTLRSDLSNFKEVMTPFLLDGVELV